MSGIVAAGDRELEDDTGARPGIASVLVLLGALVAVLNNTVLTGVVPTLAVHFGTVEQSTLNWTLGGSALGMAATAPLAGWLADRLGGRLVAVAGAVLFGAGSALGAGADSIDGLVTFRIVQGLGGGLLVPLSVLAVARLAGPRRLGYATAAITVALVTAPLFVPRVTGWVALTNWHGVFWFSLGGAVVALLGAIGIPGRTVQRSGVDATGAASVLLLPIGLVLFTYGLASIVGVYGTPAPHEFALWRGIVAVAVGLIMIVAAVAAALSSRAPVIDLVAIGRRSVALAALALVWVGLGGMTILLPAYLQITRELSFIGAGRRLELAALGVLVGALIGGVLSRRVPAAMFAVPGLFFAIVGLSVAGLFATSASATDAGLVVMGLGLGLTVAPLFTSLLAGLPDRHLAGVSSAVAVVIGIGGAIGSAVAGMVATHALIAHRAVGGTTPTTMMSAYRTAYHHAFVPALGALVVALVVAVFTPRTNGGNTAPTGTFPPPVTG